MEKPKFDKRIFWDVDFENIDYETRASWVIERVFDRGDVEDIRECIRKYGDAKISMALTTAKWLRLNTIYFASALFNNELKDYRCYREASNSQHWIY